MPSVHQDLEPNLPKRQSTGATAISDQKDNCLMDNHDASSIKIGDILLDEKKEQEIKMPLVSQTFALDKSGAIDFAKTTFS